MTTSHADVSALATIRQAVEAAENAADADAAAALFADDIVAMVPDFPVQEGRGACTAFMRDVMGWLAAHFDRHITYTSAEVVISGEIAFDRGTFLVTVSPKDGGAASHVTGKYFWLLRRTASEPWKIARLIVSRDDESGAHAADEC